MRFYLITDADRSENGEGKCRVAWAGSQGEAASIRKQWVSGGTKRADITTDEVDVPTDKAGLLKFLNDCAVIVPAGQ